MACPICSSTSAKLIESKLLVSGQRRRRRECHRCQHRWTTWEQVGPPRPKPPPRPRKPPAPPQPQLTPDQVRQILTDQRPHKTMARAIGRSREAIRQVRHGIIHAAVHPDIKRWDRQPPPEPAVAGITCQQCQHWADRCTFGYPDPLIEGLTFAQDCIMYTP